MALSECLCSLLLVLYACVQLVLFSSDYLSSGSEPIIDGEFPQKKNISGVEQIVNSKLLPKNSTGPELIIDGNFLQKNTIGDKNANWVSREYRPSYPQPSRWWSVNAAGRAQSGYWGGYMYQRVQLEANKTYRLSFNAVKVWTSPKPGQRRPFRSLLVSLLEAPVTYGFLPAQEDQSNSDPNRPTTQDPANRILIYLAGSQVPPTPTNTAAAYIGRQLVDGITNIEFPTAVAGEYNLAFWATGDWLEEQYRSTVANVSLRAVIKSA